MMLFGWGKGRRGIRARESGRAERKGEVEGRHCGVGSAFVRCNGNMKGGEEKCVAWMMMIRVVME